MVVFIAIPTLSFTGYKDLQNSWSGAFTMLKITLAKFVTSTLFSKQENK